MEGGRGEGELREKWGEDMCIKVLLCFKNDTWEKLALWENIECSCDSDIFILSSYQGFIQREGGRGIPLPQEI